MKVSRGSFLSSVQVLFRFQASFFPLVALWLEAFFLALFLRVKNVLIVFSDVCKKTRSCNPLLSVTMALKSRELEWIKWKRSRKEDLFFDALLAFPGIKDFLFPVFLFLFREGVLFEGFSFVKLAFLKMFKARANLKALAKRLFFDFLDIDAKVLFKLSQKGFPFSWWERGKCPVMTLLS